MSRSSGSAGHTTAGNSGASPSSTTGPVDFIALYEETCRLEDLLTIHPTPSNISNIRRVIRNHRRVVEAFTNHQPPPDTVSSRPHANTSPSRSANASSGGGNPSSNRAERSARREKEDFCRVNHTAITMLTERVQALELVLELRRRPDFFRDMMKQIQGESG